jgi:YgiT-type zinc finger domain-containing protein
MTQKREHCYFCGHGILEPQRVTLDLRRGHRLIVIKNVPALVCDECGERQYSLETSREIDRIIAEMDRTGQAEEEIKVPVVSMS